MEVYYNIFLCIGVMAAVIAIGSAYGFAVTHNDNASEVKKITQICMFSSFVVGVVCLCGIWLAAWELLYNGWIMLGCLIIGLALTLSGPFVFPAKKMRQNTTFSTWMAGMIYIVSGIVLISLAAVLFLIFTFHVDGWVSGIALCLFYAAFTAMIAGIHKYVKQMPEEEVEEKQKSAQQIQIESFCTGNLDSDAELALYNE